MDRHSVTAWDWVRINYHVPWPINLIISKEAMETYQDIFAVLLRVRWVAQNVHNAWRHVARAQT